MAPLDGGKSPKAADRSDDDTARAALFLGFNFISTVALIQCNKYVFTKAHFGFPAVLSNVHYVTSWGCLALLKRLSPALVPTLEVGRPLHTDRDFLAMCVLIGSVTPLNNMSLRAAESLGHLTRHCCCSTAWRVTRDSPFITRRQLNPIAWYQTAKLAVTPVVVAIEYGLDGVVPSATRAACLVLVCLFVVKMRGEPAAGGAPQSAAGLICVAIWVPLAAAYKVQFGRLRRKLGKCSTLALMHALFPYALVVQTVLSPLVDPPGLFQYEWRPSALFAVAASGLGAFLVNYSGFLVVAGSAYQRSAYQRSKCTELFAHRSATSARCHTCSSARRRAPRRSCAPHLSSARAIQPGNSSARPARWHRSSRTHISSNQLLFNVPVRVIHESYAVIYTR